ncbi:MAG TPA: ATP-binding protein [Bacillota bacterium]|nr:ATP-binding protein [Bacillota bacterium]
MNVFALISLFSSIIVVYLGNFVYYQNKRERLNIVFALHCLCLSATAFCEFMYRQTQDIHTAWLWLKISSFWPFSLGFLLHFTLLFTNNSFPKRLRHFFIYTPVFLLSIGALIFSEPVKEYWGYTYGRTEVMKAIGALSGLFGFLALLLFIRYYFQVRDVKKKKQTKFIVLGQLFPLVASTFIEGLLPSFKIYLPECISASTTIFAVFTGYAIWKYQLFVINPATTAKNIIATMPDSLILLDTDFKILETNQALLNLLGYEKSELIGKPVDIIFNNPADIEIIGAELLAQGKIQNTEANCQTKQGAMIPVLFSGSVIKDKQENIAGIVGIGSDIRGIKQLQAQLFQSEKLAAIGQLAGGVAHEINNPVGVILGFAQGVVKRIKEDDPLYPPLKSIEREAIRCKKLVGDLLTFSRTEKSQAEPFDINQTIEETLSLLEAGTKVKQIELDKEYQPNLPMITANRNQLQQVIFNITSNAVDAMPNGGKIKVITKQTGDQIIISISDTGPGMTEEVKNHLFEPFFTTKDIGKGTGLGLSLSYEIIKKHHGSIEVESEPGQGATFIIKLPKDGAGK